MSDFVNKIKKGATEYDIRDARVPHPTSEDNGKAIKVNAQGEFELGNDIAKDARIPDPQNADYGKFLHVNDSTGALEYAEAGGGSSAQVIELTSNPTLQDLITAVGWDKTENMTLYCELKYFRFGSNYDYVGNLTLKMQGGVIVFDFKCEFNGLERIFGHGNVAEGNESTTYVQDLMTGSGSQIFSLYEKCKDGQDYVAITNSSGDLMWISLSDFKELLNGGE